MKLKNKLDARFNMKDLGSPDYVLAFHITRDVKQGELWIDQGRYIEGVLKKFGMLDCNPYSAPINNNQKLPEIPQTDLENSDIKNIPYQSAIGSLLYAAQGTRSDISFAISLLSRFNNNPSKIHWTAFERVTRYLTG
ncbi:hypothetical protein Trydic_g4665 [Trypoxylus dichotomus]